MLRKASLLRKTSLIAAALCVALVGSGASAQQRTMTIGTGGPGGVYYPLGGGLAKVLSEAMPGLQATAILTAGATDNVRLIDTGKSELGLSMVDVAFDAQNGLDKFKGNKIDLRTLLVMYPNRMHLVTIEGTGIEKMADLKGKRVSTNTPGTAVEIMAFRALEAAGLDKDKDIQRESLYVSDSVKALIAKKIDAFFWVGGLPTPPITELGATPGVKIKLIDHAEVIAKMNAKYGNLYSADVIPKGTYPGQDKDNKIAVVWNILVTDGKMSDQDAYTIVKTVFDKQAELIAAHPEAKSIQLDKQTTANTPIPFHEGAKKYLAEKGVKM